MTLKNKKLFDQKVGPNVTRYFFGVKESDGLDKNFAFLHGSDKQF